MARSPAAKAMRPSPLGLEPTGESLTAEQAELAEVRAQLREAQQTIEAIRGGGIDSLMIGPPGQEQVYALVSADRPYRLIVEAMNEGAATVSPRGVILNANARLAAMTGRSAAHLVGTAVLDLIPDVHRSAFAELLDIGTGGSSRGEVDLTGPGGTTVPVLLAVSGFDLDGMFLRCLVLTDLTAQRAAERQAAEAHEALREQTSVLEQAQESLGLGWWNYAPEREEMLTFSPAACRIFGLIPAEFDRKLGTLSSLVHPDDLPRINEAYRAALAGGPPYQAEHRIVRPDGELRWILMAAVVQHDDTDGPKRMLGICQDITDRKRIEDEIRASAAYNRSLIEANLNPMVTIGPDGTITDLNAATEQATGRERAELVGTEFSGYFTEPDLARAGYEQVFRDGSVRDYPLELAPPRTGTHFGAVQRLGLPRPVRAGARGLRRGARRHQDNRTQAALRESEERLRALFDNAPVGIDELTVSGESGPGQPPLSASSSATPPTSCAHPATPGHHPSRRPRRRSGRSAAPASRGDRYLLDGQRYPAKRRRSRVGRGEPSRGPRPGRQPAAVIGVVRDITAQREPRPRSGCSRRPRSPGPVSARLTWSGPTRTWRRSPTRSPMTCAPRCER